MWVEVDAYRFSSESGSGSGMIDRVEVVDVDRNRASFKLDLLSKLILFSLCYYLLSILYFSCSSLVESQSDGWLKRES